MKVALGKSKSIKRAISSLTKFIGGLENISSIGQLPRDQNQGSYIKKEMKEVNVSGPIFLLTKKIDSYKDSSLKL